MENQNLFGIDTDAALSQLGVSSPAAPPEDPFNMNASPEPEPETPDSQEDADDATLEAGDDHDEVEDTETGDDAESSIRTFKAFGKEYKVDLSDTEKISKLIPKALAAPKVFSENAQLKQKVKQLETQADPKRLEKAELFEKLEDTFKFQGEEAVYQAITGKSLEELVNARVEQRMAMMNASPEERWRLEREQAESQSKEAKRRYEAQLQAEKDRAKEIESKFREDQAYNTAYPEFQRVLSKLDLGDDPVHAQEVAENIWDQTLSRIARKYDEFELSNDKIRQEFQKTARLYNYTVKTQVKKKVAETTQKKKTEAKQQASAFATRNYNTADLQDKMSGLTPTQRHKFLFGE